MNDRIAYSLADVRDEVRAWRRVSHHHRHAENRYIELPADLADRAVADEPLWGRHCPVRMVRCPVPGTVKRGRKSAGLVIAET